MGLVILGLCLLAAGFAVRKFISLESPQHQQFVNFGGWAVKFSGMIVFLLGAFNGSVFYAEPGFKYHVRTIFGVEKMVDDVGYNTRWFGQVNAWKNAMSVQSLDGGTGVLSAELEGTAMSANLPPKSLVFLDQVDALVSATARFQLPADEETFLRLARQFRSPENLLRTELVPAFQETLGATAALMAAEDYFQGGQTEFNSEFQRQMEDGIYLVRRVEKRVNVEADSPGSANAALGEDQQRYGENTKTIFIVEKLQDSSGQPRRKTQSFTNFGITVASARVTDVNPNDKFRERMGLRQQAAADRAIAREQRIQEEEQRLLAIAKGEREVAERQASAKVEQIEQTTNALTKKQLAITEADQRREQAVIDNERAKILLETARIDADARRVAADAEAYAKQEILAADNALAQKLDAEIEIQKLWAAAYAERKVPQYVFGGSAGSEGPPTGADGEARLLQQLLTMEYAKRLDYDRTIQGGDEVAR